MKPISHKKYNLSIIIQWFSFLQEKLFVLTQLSISIINYSAGKHLHHLLKRNKHLNLAPIPFIPPWLFILVTTAVNTFYRRIRLHLYWSLFMIKFAVDWLKNESTQIIKSHNLNKSVRFHQIHWSIHVSNQLFRQKFQFILVFNVVFSTGRFFVLVHSVSHAVMDWEYLFEMNGGLTKHLYEDIFVEVK